MTHQVFVSYSQPDRDCAFELVSHLETQGIGVWIAPRDISPGADWAAEIIDAIAAARVMILVFSAHSNSSPQVRREVERAVHRQLSVLTFRIEDILPSKSLEYFLSAQHWLDAFPPPRAAHYLRLCTHLGALLKTAEPPPTAAVRADAAAPVGEAQRQFLARQLAVHVGPVALHLVKRAATMATDWEQLTQRLAAEIDSEAGRRQFREACRHWMDHVVSQRH